MSQFKNLDGYKLFYTDTDSVYYNKPLPEHLVSNTELGKLKLESINKKTIFLGSKSYGLLDIDGNETIKIKGLSKQGIKYNNINLDVIENLLYKNTIFDATQSK